jgi:uncharacterized protein (DUF779 family)
MESLCQFGSEEIPARFLKNADGTIPRVVATDAAIQLIEQLIGTHGLLLFHQSGGCCDGSAPMCFQRTEFKLGARDICLGDIDRQPFYISGPQFEAWKHTQLIIDVVPGRGSSFSLEIPLGVRFLTRSRTFSVEEMAILDPKV